MYNQKIFKNFLVTVYNLKMRPNLKSTMCLGYNETNVH